MEQKYLPIHNSQGLQTLQAEDGLVAVELFKENHPRPAIILLDINM